LENILKECATEDKKVNRNEIKANVDLTNVDLPDKLGIFLEA